MTDDTAPLLTITFGAEVLATLRARDLPADLRPNVFWQGAPAGQPDAEPAARVLSFTGPTGVLAAFDLGVIPWHEASCASLSIRIAATGVVQVDGLLGKGELPDPARFRAGETPGVRMQPFFLPGLVTSPLPPAGSGLFGRGLHYAGFVTRSNVSLLCRCDRCAKTFRLQSFHTGNSLLRYFYCGKGRHTLTVSGPAAQDPTFEGAKIDPSLPSCDACGEDFRHTNPLRCPHCVVPYIDFAAFPELRASEIYGNVFFGETAQTIAR